MVAQFSVLWQVFCFPEVAFSVHFEENQTQLCNYLRVSAPCVMEEGQEIKLSQTFYHFVYSATCAGGFLGHGTVPKKNHEKLSNRFKVIQFWKSHLPLH